MLGLTSTTAIFLSFLCLLPTSVISSSSGFKHGYSVHRRTSSTSSSRRSPHHHHAATHHDLSPIPHKATGKRSLPTGWSYVGCYQDPSATRLLSVRLASGSTTTQEMCTALCQSYGYVYAGVEYSVECWCGSTLNQPQTTSGSSCNMPCSGNSGEMCGAGNVIGLLQYTASAPSSTWTNLGCYTDGNTRTLSGPTTSSSSMTPSYCQSWCSSQSYTYAGVEDGNQCFCGNSAPTASSSSNCGMACSGSSTQTCGGGWAITIYQAPSGSGTTPPSGTWTSLGCYQDQSARTLGGASTSGNTMTPSICQNFCGQQGYTYAGTENGNQCFCGNTLTPNSPISSSSCQTACIGNTAQMCGGGWALSVYQTGSGSSSTSTTSASTTTTSSAPTQSAGATLLGCYQDQNSRTLSGPNTSSSSMTPAVCQAWCASQGSYPYFGVEYASQCYCGTSITTPKVLPSSSCSAPCSGNTAQVCGGTNWEISIYQVTSGTTSTISSTASSTTTTSSASATATTTWTAIGCYQDQSARTLNGATTTSTTLTPAICQSYCATQGYTYAGVENARECYCGNTLTTNQPLAASNCQAPCAGDATQYCGGSNWDVFIYAATTGNGTTASSIGCYQDQTTRTLNGPSKVSATMTPAVCGAFCASQGTYAYYGVENHQECYCGNTLTTIQQLPSSSCTATCSGDPTQICGGTNWALSLFSSSGSLAPPTPPSYTQVGCFQDTNSRLLTTLALNGQNYTPSTCQTYCASQAFAYAGVESGGQCWCGASISYTSDSGGILMPAGSCSQACGANGALQCGGTWLLMIYYSRALDTGSCQT